MRSTARHVCLQECPRPCTAVSQVSGGSRSRTARHCEPLLRSLVFQPPWSLPLTSLLSRCTTPLSSQGSLELGRLDIFTGMATVSLFIFFLWLLSLLSEREGWQPKLPFLPVHRRSWGTWTSVRNGKDCVSTLRCFWCSCVRFTSMTLGSSETRSTSLAQRARMAGERRHFKPQVNRLVFSVGHGVIVLIVQCSLAVEDRWACWFRFGVQQGS